MFHLVLLIVLQTPAGQINMRDARVEEVEHLSDSDSEERDSEQPDLTIGIFPTNQGPTYLLCPGKQVNYPILSNLLHMLVCY